VSTVVRVPDEVLAHVQRIAAMQGTVPGEILARAWDEFFENHREEFAAEFAAAAKAVRDNDTAAMASLMKRGNRERAVRAAAQARRPASY